jgi:hypothetical protein
MQPKGDRGDENEGDGDQTVLGHGFDSSSP